MTKTTAVLTQRQYRILNACADDWELFYYLALALRSPSGSLESGVIEQVSDGLVADLLGLMQAGFLQCRRVSENGTRENLSSPDQEEFAIYRSYSCRSLQEHVARFGYGPHEFKAAARGIEEISKASYRGYDIELGW